LSVQPYDEKKIKPEEVIIRRINPVQHVVWDENRGCNRISSKAFSPSSGENGGMSVDIEDLILEGGHNPKQYVTTPIFTGSVAFSADNVRNLGLRIGYDPIQENPYHGEVWGSPRANRFSNPQKKGLLAASEWYVEIEGVSLD
jgi:hypothetical protein